MIFPNAFSCFVIQISQKYAVEGLMIIQFTDANVRHRASICINSSLMDIDNGFMITEEQ